MSSRTPSRIIAIAAIGSLGALLAGCTSVDPGMGEALKYDMVAQTVNPEPVYASTGARAGSSGDHAALATERYRKGTIKELKVESSTSTSSSGSGSSGK
ncbi:hypothetical protein [Sphingomonas sp.]|uniref:hypothetical protein n=1 Tax=Sphingomonas sp. TaxID=28214 RepID=UPI00286A7101|nr:hypothetical protein [Sphingomonas sp.]